MRHARKHLDDNGPTRSTFVPTLRYRGFDQKLNVQARARKMFHAATFRVPSQHAPIRSQMGSIVGIIACAFAVGVCVCLSCLVLSCFCVPFPLLVVALMPSPSGGENAISVYQITDALPSEPTPAPVDADTPSGSDGYDSLGCFADNQPDASGEATRIMTRDVSSDDMTAEVGDYSVRRSDLL